MNRMLKLGMVGILTAWAISAPVCALELGERVPLLKLTDSQGQPFFLPSHQRPEPTVVWFPFPWRTPHQLFDKLLSVTEANKVSLVIVPVFDATNFKRLAHAIDNSDKLESASAPEDSATTTQADSSAQDSSETTTAPLGEATTAPLGETTTAPLGEATTTTPSKATVAAPSEATSTTPGKADPAIPSEATAATPSEATDVIPDDLAQMQDRYLQRLQQMERAFPKAYFVNDKNNATLIAYTQMSITNILPNPNLFIIDAHGYITWSGFYPGLTIGTLTRAIASARLDKHNN